MARRHEPVATVATRAFAVHGKCSIERLLALEEYTRTTSYWHVLWVIFWVPLVPVVIALVYQLPRLAPPDAGLQANWVYVVERAGLGLVISFDCCLTTVCTLFPELIPRIPFRVRVVSDVILGVVYVITIVVLGLTWGFPVPFTSSIANPISGVTGIAILYVIARPIAKTSSTFRRRFVMCFIYAAVFSFASIVYPAYMAFFFAVGERYPDYQPLVTLLTPLMKLLLRKIMAYAVREWEDLIPVMVIFTVEFFSSLYQVVSVQTSSSMITTAAIIALDFGTTARSQWRLYQCTKSLRELIHATDTDALLPVVAGVCDELASLKASEVQNVQRLGSIHLYSAAHNADISSAARHRLETIEAANVFSSVKMTPQSCVVPSRSVSRRRATTMASTPRSAVVSTAGLIPASSPNAKTSIVTIAAQHQQSAVVFEATSMLFRTEFLLLTEYLECVIPLFYAVNVVLIWLSPNAPYYPTTGAIKTVDELRGVVVDIMVLFALEVASFVVPSVVLWTRLRFSPLHQLAFALEHQATVIRANMLFVLLLSLHFNLVHAGADFSFKFKWIHSSGTG